MSVQVTKYDDIIDSRDVIERIEELENEVADLQLQVMEAREIGLVDVLDAAEQELQDWEDLWRDELTALLRLQEEAKGINADWNFGTTLIRDSYFETYAEDEVRNCGYLIGDQPWWISIDWETTANNLKTDYSLVDFDGEEYWVRD